MAFSAVSAQAMQLAWRGADALAHCTIRDIDVVDAYSDLMRSVVTGEARVPTLADHHGFLSLLAYGHPDDDDATQRSVHEPICVPYERVVSFERICERCLAHLNVRTEAIEGGALRVHLA